MFGNIGKTIEIMKKSWQTLMMDKELVVFPIAGAVGAVIVVALGALAVFLTLPEDTGEGLSFGAASIIAVVLVYIFSTFFVTFGNAALVAGVIERLRGGDPTIGSAFGKAARHVLHLFLWSVILAVFSLILNALREQARNSNNMAAIIISAIGLSIIAGLWSVISFFVIPIIMMENHGPIGALKRSYELLKSTWGTQIGASFGFGILYILAALPGILIGLGLFLANPVVGISVGGVLVLLASGLVSVLSSVFRGVLYQYAITDFGRTTLPSATPEPAADTAASSGTAPDAKKQPYRVFNADELLNAYKPKKA